MLRESWDESRRFGFILFSFFLSFFLVFLFFSFSFWFHFFFFFFFFFSPFSLLFIFTIKAKGVTLIRAKALF